MIISKTFRMIWLFSPFLFLVSCSSQHLVTKASKDSPEGIYYALPRTVISVDAVITKTTTKASPLMERLANQPDFTNFLLYVSQQLEIPLKNFVTISNAGSTYSLTNVVLSTYAEPDPENIYSIEVTGGWFANRSFDGKFSENGLLASAESTVEDKKLDFALKFLETGAELGGKVIGAALTQQISTGTPNVLDEGTNIVSQIMQLRATRRTIIEDIWAKTPNIQPATADTILKEMEGRENALLAIFKGMKEVDVSTIRFDVRPSTKGLLPQAYANGDSIELMKWNANLGFLLANDRIVTPPLLDDDYVALVEKTISFDK